MRQTPVAVLAYERRKLKVTLTPIIKRALVESCVIRPLRSMSFICEAAGFPFSRDAILAGASGLPSKSYL